jgi:hypothetical protein
MARNSNSTRGHRPGGGIASRQHVAKPVRTGQRAEAINEKGVAQIGSSMGNHATDGRRAVNPVEKVRGAPRPAGGPSGVPLGNAVAGNVGKGGVGTGRTLYGQSGTNQVHGKVAGSPKPWGADILSQFGPESKPR